MPDGSFVVIRDDASNRDDVEIRFVVNWVRGVDATRAAGALENINTYIINVMYKHTHETPANNDRRGAR